MNVQAIWGFGSLIFKQKLFASRSLLPTEVHNTLEGMGEFKICIDFQIFCSFETLINSRMGLRIANTLKVLTHWNTLEYIFSGSGKLILIVLLIGRRFQHTSILDHTWRYTFLSLSIHPGCCLLLLSSFMCTLVNVYFDFLRIKITFSCTFLQSTWTILQLLVRNILKWKYQ